VQRFMLKSKIHRATLTGTDLNYEGSIAIDRDLLVTADILPGEQVHVLNLSNGARLVTYAIEADAGSGTMLLNGPAARMGVPGDLVVIITYAACSEEEIRRHKPRVVKVDERNRIRREK
jgi:aspartate 1-decarboxylase